MIITNGYRDQEEQCEAIAANKGAVLNCDLCELADRCPNNKLHRDKANSSYQTYYMKEFGSCYIPWGTAVVECGSKNVSEGIGDAYKVDPLNFPDEYDYYEDDSYEDDSYEDNSYEDDSYEDDSYEDDSYEDDSDEDDFDEEYPDAELKELNKNGWEPAQPVFISAQTGQGKNYFIENTLIPYVRDLNYQSHCKFKVLIISNRLALKKQIENHIENPEDYDDLFKYSDITDVITYQGLLRQEKKFKGIQKKKGGQYLYVICDEAHFFTSDAMFNPQTERILLKIVDLFKNSIRIYMSATPYECLEFITEKESEFFDRSNDLLNDNIIALYHFDRDYSYLKVKVFSQFDELYDGIANSVEHKVRWLIFHDNIGQCKIIEKALESRIPKGEKQGKNESKVIALDADSKGEEKFRSLIKNEALDPETYVLISTSVLDNGVNLKNIDNIIVSYTDIVKCLQMVGRARYDKKEKAKKTIYIRRFDATYIKKRITDYEMDKEAYHLFDLAYNSHYTYDSRNSDEIKFLSKYCNGCERDQIIAKRLFDRERNDPNKLYINGISRTLVDNRAEMYRLVLEEMDREAIRQQTDDNIYVGQGYLEYQLSWFGVEYCVDNDLTFQDKDKKKKALIAFLENHAKNNMILGTESQENRKTGGNSQAEDDGKYDSQEEFKKEFTKLYDATFGRADKNKERVYGFSKINNLLRDSKLPFRMVSNKNGWTVQEYNWDNENSDGEK